MGRVQSGQLTYIQNDVGIHDKKGLFLVNLVCMSISHYCVSLYPYKCHHESRPPYFIFRTCVSFLCPYFILHFYYLLIYRGSCISIKVHLLNYTKLCEQKSVFNLAIIHETGSEYICIYLNHTGAKQLFCGKQITVVHGKQMKGCHSSSF